MENSASSNIWTYCARWHRYFASLIETNVFEISCLLCMSFCFVILYVTIWCKDNKLIIYLYLSFVTPWAVIGVMMSGLTVKAKTFANQYVSFSSCQWFGLGYRQVPWFGWRKVGVTTSRTVSVLFSTVSGIHWSWRTVIWESRAVALSVVGRSVVVDSQDVALIGRVRLGATCVQHMSFPLLREEHQVF